MLTDHPQNPLTVLKTKTSLPIGETKIQTVIMGDGALHLLPQIQTVPTGMGRRPIGATTMAMQQGIPMIPTHHEARGTHPPQLKTIAHRITEMLMVATRDSSITIATPMAVRQQQGHPRKHLNVDGCHVCGQVGCHTWFHENSSSRFPRGNETKVK